MKMLIIICLAVLLTLSSLAFCQTLEIGFEPLSGPSATFTYSRLSTSASFQMWQTGPVNEYANNVPVEGGFRAQIQWAFPWLEGNRFQPYVGLEFRKRFERIGNKSNLFEEYYRPWGDHFAALPLKGQPGTADVDPNPTRHPGYIRDDRFLGQYSHFGPVAGLVFKLNRLVYLRGSVSYLPVIGSSTIEDHFAGAYNYASLGQSLFADLGITVDILGMDQSFLTW